MAGGGGGKGFPSSHTHLDCPKSPELAPNLPLEPPNPTVYPQIRTHTPNCPKSLKLGPNLPLEPQNTPV